MPIQQMLLGTGSSSGGGSIDPYISGYLHYHGSSAAGFGAFWQNESDGSISDLEINPTGIDAFNEYTSEIQEDADDDWTYFTIDLTGKANGRLYFYCRKATGDCTDLALDDIRFYHSDGTGYVDFDPSLSSVRDNDLWEGSTPPKPVSSYATAKANYATDNSYGNIYDNDLAARWNWDTNTTPSSCAGPSGAAPNNVSDTYYVYWEGSGNNSTNNDGSYLRWSDYYNVTTGATI